MTIDDEVPARTAQEILELLGPLVDEQKSLIDAENDARKFFAEQRTPYDNTIRDLRQELRLLMMASNAAAEFGGGLKATLRRRVQFSIADDGLVRRELLARGELERCLVLDAKRVEVMAKKSSIPGTSLVDVRELVVTEVKD